MGLYRFALAALVVLFHFGGLPWVVGRVAVFGFYCVSGLLIFQVLDRIYLKESGGAIRFFANRLVRLGPLYVAYAVLTLALVSWSGPDGLREPDGRPILPEAEGSRRVLLWETLTLQGTAGTVGSVPVLAFSAPLLPQGWSIGVEASFYILAPMVVLATRRRPWAVALWIAGGLLVFLGAVRAAGEDLDAFQVLVYKNAAASWFVFFIGGGLYYLRRRWGQPISFAVAAAVATIWAAVLVHPALAAVVGPASSEAFAGHLWLALLVAGVVSLAAPPTLRWLDTMGGNLSYGVYLNHFLVAGLLLHAGGAEWTGPPGTMAFGIAVLAGSALLSLVTYLFVERPFDGIRATVRRTPVREAAVNRPLVPVNLTAVATVVCLAFLASPLRATVDQWNGPDAVVMPGAVSAKFHIRWKPDLTEAERLRLEAQLGLVERVLVERDPRRRTWEYRLRNPTSDRVRAAVTHGAVEDTARVDLEQFQIVP